MKSQILQYKLEPKIYRILSDEKPYKTVIDKFTVYEEYKKNSEYNVIGTEFGDYIIIIESKVSDTHELQNRHFETSKFICSLDRSWIYVCLHPLTKKEFAFMGNHIQWPGEKLSGWNSNYNIVEDELNKGRAHAKFSLKSMPNASFQYWPLQRALQIREKYLVASEETKALIDLHYFSLSVNSGYAMLLFLGKALELVRSLLPGNNKTEKEKFLPVDIKEKLHSSFNKILDLSNNRFETRHIVRNQKDRAMHSRLTNEEIETYKNDVDLIIRATVCAELCIDLVIPNRK